MMPCPMASFSSGFPGGKGSGLPWFLDTIRVGVLGICCIRQTAWQIMEIYPPLAALIVAGDTEDVSFLMWVRVVSGLLGCGA